MRETTLSFVQNMIGGSAKHNRLLAKQSLGQFVITYMLSFIIKLSSIIIRKQDGRLKIYIFNKSICNIFKK